MDPKTLYDLPKEMLIQLISTIRSETIKEYDEKIKSLRNIFTRDEAKFLASTSSKNHQRENPWYDGTDDRFVVINKEEEHLPVEIAKSKESTHFWCDNIANAVLLKNFFVAHGKKVVLLLDDGYDAPFCVFTEDGLDVH